MNHEKSITRRCMGDKMQAGAARYNILFREIQWVNHEKSITRRCMGDKMQAGAARYNILFLEIQWESRKKDFALLYV